MSRKESTIVRLQNPPKIDGILDDPVWEEIVPLTDFIMYQPGNGKAERKTHKTELYVGYDDEAFYVGAKMYDPSPDSILTQLTERDDLNANADWLGIFINPFNDGLNDFNFWITAAGVQVDSRTTSEGDDRGWNTVWSSSVTIVEDGWVAELKIPYRCLRFPKAQGRTWGFNSIRYIRRYREEYSWSFLDRNIDNLKFQAGRLNGVSAINAPVRLSIMPNITASASHYEGNWETESFNAGADIKYGINESFTLDVTLLPDFSQVAFDNQVLNLGPFENRFYENRQFFTEGTELFNKRDLFYSRRIGGAPQNITRNNADDLDNVTVEFTRMLNATKVSGRTKNNLGIGVLNAITANNFTTGSDSLGRSVSVLTEPLTNYNVASFEKRFWRNSSVSFINTNVLRDGSYRDANVATVLADLADKTNTWRYEQQFSYSTLLENNATLGGFKNTIDIENQAGKVRFGLGNYIESDTYDQNDLGFQRRNNRFNFDGFISYQIIEPKGAFNRYRFELSGNYNNLYLPRKFESANIKLEGFGLLRSFNAFGGNITIRPTKSNDYYEPRYWGKVFVQPSMSSYYAWFSSDYRKVFALDLRFGYWNWSELGHRGTQISIEPRVRINDHWMFITEFKPVRNNSEYGWVNQLGNQGDSIVMGRRNRQEFILTIGTKYVFNPNAWLTLNFRHYWSNVSYQDYWLLLDDGSLERFPTYDGDHDVNFNTLNIDLKFSWWFAPGSEMVLLYRNSLATSSDKVDDHYIYNLSKTLNTPQHHTFSIRVVYFLDYNDVAAQFRHD